MPGSSLLSHGETPHYHRRYGVSLLSSAWGQVGPPRCCRQANSLCPERLFYPDAALAALVKSVTYFSMLFPFRHCRLASAQKRSFLQIWYQLKICLSSPKHLRRCKVKPHGSLVPVSSTHRCAYTPGLSTSSSSTFLQETYSLRENSSRGKFRA